MGFFSRMFKLREQDSSSPETTWAYEDNASELILDPEYAATLMTEFDIDAAIASHEEWEAAFAQPAGRPIERSTRARKSA